MLAVARRYSLCPDDAHDAWQRSVEILLRRASSLEPTTAPAWLRTVVKHEALAIRSERSRNLDPDGVEPDSREGSANTEADSERFELLATAAEALHSLKPSEAEALLMLASGMSYREIGEAKGWTYTKVNRLLTEGRRAFRARVSGIESGDECERWRPTLTKIADGEADSTERASIRLHLRRCSGCRAALRGERRLLGGLGLLVPGLGSPASAGVDSGGGAWRGIRDSVADLLLSLGVRAQGATEAVTASKAVAVAASAAAIAGGGVAAHGEATSHSPAKPKTAAPALAAPNPQPSAPVVQSDPREPYGNADSSAVGLSDGREAAPVEPERAASAEFDPMSAPGSSTESPPSASLAPPEAEARPKPPISRSARPEPRVPVGKTAGPEFGP